MEQKVFPVESVKIFLRRYAAAVLIGILVGLVGVAFHLAIELATEARLAHPWLLLFLPLGGAAIIRLYSACGMEKDRGTNLVLVAVREHEPMRLRTAPLIFLSTALTHLVGGSSGREGAALQLGASISSKISHTMKLRANDGRILTVCGMAAAFSALFGTPLAAAMFALEVVHVGVLQYAALVPALVSSLTAYLVAGFFQVPPTAYAVSALPVLSAAALVRVTVLGAACAAVSVLFCRSMHTAHHLYERVFPNPYLRAAAGGALVLVLTVVVGLAHGSALGFPIYNGAGGNLTFGCAAAPLLGLSPSFGGALGMVALFCGVTNCPLTSILLAYELFGGAGLPLFALGIAVAYRLSGNSSLYAEQRIVYSKFQPIPNED